LLETVRFRDYCPNGLQVEGRTRVSKVVTGVSASMDLLQSAVASGADAVLVHHGYFWKGEAPQVTGIKRKRLGLLLERDVSLLAYHLPLDAHRQLGNNAQLAERLQFAVEGWFGEQDIAAYGSLAAPLTLAELTGRVAAVLDRVPLVVGDPSRKVRRISWCSGAAQDMFADAIALGVDAFVTGEVSERTIHLARESGVAFIGAGHHATERYGVQALGEHLAARFGLEHRYIDIANPV
jgi:dinuclear metal center YbgI/SA1388 family protein